MKVGLYFGSFNPIHLGHINLAQYILQHCALDEVWLVVSPNNPLKRKSDLWDEQLRLRLVQIATKDIPHITASDFEFHLPRPSYTVDTLKAMSMAYPEHDFYIIIGSDNMAIFSHWKEYEYILQHYNILVYPREGDDLISLSALYPQMKIINGAPLFPVSSTMIREGLKAGKDVSLWLNDNVASEIYQKFNLQD